MATLFMILVAAAAASAQSVSRDLPDSSTAGSSFSVALSVSPGATATYYAIDEIVPTGWIVTAATAGGDFTSQTGHVKWVVVSGAASTVYSYNVTPSLSASGSVPYSFGIFQFEGQSDSLFIGGDSSVAVTAPPIQDFTITLNQSSISIPRNFSKPVTVTITPLSGYNQVVTLTALSVPSGTIASFSPTSSIPAFASTLTLATSPSSALATTIITVKATGADNKTQNTTLSLAVTVPPVCGNSVVEAGESCDGTNFGGATCATALGGGSTGNLSCTFSCSLDTSACTPPPTVPVTVNVLQDSATLGVPAAQSGQTISWNLSQPSKLAITLVKVVVNATVTAGQLSIQKLIGSPALAPDLQNAYQFFTFTPTNIQDNKITSVIVSFAVNKTWLNQTKVSQSTVKLNRLVNSTWMPLVTSKTGEDSNFVYYDAISPGLSVFGINGAVTAPQCPACPQSSSTECTVQQDGSGIQSVTTYTCSPQTDFECVQSTAPQSCCPTCPPPGEYGSCAPEGQRTRQAFACSNQTEFKCVQTTESQACISQEIAEASIAMAQQAINTANSQNRDTTVAEGILQQARSALAAGNYDQAKSLADQARVSSQNAPEKAFPIPGGPLVLIAILAAVAAAILIVVLRMKGILIFRHKVQDHCYIGGEETILGFRCEVCSQRVCIRHARTQNGRVFCEKHAPKGPEKPKGEEKPKPPPKPPPSPEEEL